MENPCSIWWLNLWGSSCIHSIERLPCVQIWSQQIWLWLTVCARHAGALESQSIMSQLQEVNINPMVQLNPLYNKYVWKLESWSVRLRKQSEEISLSSVQSPSLQLGSSACCLAEQQIHRQTRHNSFWESFRPHVHWQTLHVWWKCVSVHQTWQKGSSKGCKGIWLGKALTNGHHIIGYKEGIFMTCSVRRLPTAFNLEDLGDVTRARGNMGMQRLATGWCTTDIFPHLLAFGMPMIRCSFFPSNAVWLPPGRSTCFQACCIWD